MEKEKIRMWENRNDKLAREMDIWRKGYFCRNNCKDWQDYKFCKHLVNANERKFKKEINQQIEIIMGASN